MPSIIGADPQKITFSREGKTDFFTIKGEGANPNPLKRQVHIPRGSYSQLTGLLREYFSPYSWKAVNLQEENKAQRVLVHAKAPEKKEAGDLFAPLYNENPFWAKIIGEEKLRTINGQEYLVSKNYFYTARNYSYETFNQTENISTKDGLIPVKRETTKNLIEKIKLIFWKLPFIQPMGWMPATIPSSGERIWIRCIDFDIASGIFGETLEYNEKLYGTSVTAPKIAANSARIHWLP